MFNIILGVCGSGVSLETHSITLDKREEKKQKELYMRNLLIPSPHFIAKKPQTQDVSQILFLFSIRLVFFGGF